MKKHQKSNAAVCRLFAFYSSFFVLGLILSYWFGLGWFFLLHAIRGLLSSVQFFSVPLMRILAGAHFTEELESRQQLKSRAYRFFSTVVVNVINFALTIFFFWRANVPLQQVIQNMVSP